MSKFRDIRGAPYHPMTQGKIERWHQTLNSRFLLENYHLPGDLEAQIEAFINHRNHRRYHESIGNLTPADVTSGAAKSLKEPEKGSNNRHWNTGACSTQITAPKITNRMGRTPSQVRRPTFPNALMTDKGRPDYSLDERIERSKILIALPARLIDTEVEQIAMHFSVGGAHLPGGRLLPITRIGRQTGEPTSIPHGEST